MRYELTDGELYPPADHRVVDGLSSALGAPLLADYLAFLLQHDGGEGFMAPTTSFFGKRRKLADFNREYEVEKYAPGILLFGSTGGGEGYGFDTQSVTLPIVRLPFIGMQRRYAKHVAQTFPELFSKLATST
jgi:hypothetical protein